MNPPPLSTLRGMVPRGHSSHVNPLPRAALKIPSLMEVVSAEE